MRRLFSLHWTGYSIAATSGEVSGDNDNWGMYMGVYAGYGFTNLLAQAKTDPLVLINAQQQIDYAGTFASNETAKANLLRCGVKIAIDFGWPKQVKEAPVEEQLPTVDEEAERLAREAAEREAAEKEAKWNDFKNRIEGINVYFANGSSEPNISEEDKAAIIELCAFLKENKEYKVVVIGHTDSYGDPEQNLRYFGMKRAEVLSDYMVSQGVEDGQIRCESKGQTEPVAPNDTRANRALNRRANIRFE